MQSFDAILKLRIDKETLQELRKIAKKHKISTSELVRRLIYVEIRKHRKNFIPRG
jgi:antitoxin component of RelBE/YafQ-DinJ toxin-antitoxin module